MLLGDTHPSALRGPCVKIPVAIIQQAQNILQTGLT